MSLPEPDAIWELPTQHVGRRVWYFQQLDSTNNLALILSQDAANKGLAILAGEQTAGRGQHGRIWQASAGSSVLLSALLFPSASVRRPALLTALAAVSVCEVIRRSTGLAARIKWPNDVLLEGKKVCGILIEQRGERGGAVVGIGLNIGQPAGFFAQADLPLAGSLLSLSGRLLDTGDVVRALLAELDGYYGRLLTGETDELEARWQAGLGLLGKHVIVEQASGSSQGRLRELAFAGVTLELPSGESLRLCPEAIRHMRDMSDS